MRKTTLLSASLVSLAAISAPVAYADSAFNNDDNSVGCAARMRPA
ncbi:hypothetical protein SAMN04488539_0461 [Corynebacterium timonense]|uniref:Uncharacterized protein n=1 Tax=Corynebacterium timonense TaxID=441500 RepID=A0A1H1M8G1_9CORY|nr:hypothetical protein SAMN04488539_0461 [Corynebacterium timonense]